MKSSPRSLQLKKVCSQQQRLRAAKNKQVNKELLGAGKKKKMVSLVFTEDKVIAQENDDVS